MSHRVALLLISVAQSGIAAADPMVFTNTVTLERHDDGGSYEGDYSLRLPQVPPGPEINGGGYTFAFLSYALTETLGQHSTIEVTGITFDAGSDWYLVREGEHFTPESIAAGTYPRLAGLGAQLGGPVDIDPSYWSSPESTLSTPSFYLGFVTNEDFNGARDVFGWVHLRAGTGTMPNPLFPALPQVDPNSLELLGDATAFGSGGIIVGTLQAIPEPNSVALILLGAIIGPVARPRQR